MSEIATQTFFSIPFYKGYLPFKEAQQAQSYVVLALTTDDAPLLYDDDTCAVGSVGSGYVVAKAPSTTPERPVTPENAASGRQAALLHPLSSLPPPPPERSPITRSRSTTNENSHASPHMLSSSIDSTGIHSAAPVATALGGGVAFYLFHKRDVQPPPIRFYVSPKKVHRCFRGCERLGCSCERIHFNPDAWRMRLETLPRLPLTVARAGQNIRVAPNQIEPTAGYFFALGLKTAKVLPAVVPTMCRFNTTCRNGIRCLYIHADTTVMPKQVQTSEITLRTWGQHVMDNALSGKEAGAFFEFLDEQGVRTVGDMQVLGNAAFDSLAARVPPRWAEAFLTLSVLRDLDTKMQLSNALMAFPRIEAPVRLPGFLNTVGDLLNLTASAFMQLQVAPFVMNACSLIRARYGTDETFSIIDLKKEQPNTFFSNATRMIQSFCRTHAHCSWRKHDPSRPVVTSVLTFVDVNKCRCHLNGDNPENKHEEHIDAPIPADIEEMGTPSGSWCQCMRRGVIAVNYELSTPSGSRCSEQNAMGKLASLGVPTWGVREVFVHGRAAKEPNPLFPCGVCENMLRRVTKDVLAHYGGDVTLYMFDATTPRKIVFLTIPEISNRDGANFKKFVAEDLRSR
ncbi:A distinct subfamily of CDD/CDA-like deaminases protein [Leishmania donovani]|uniref:A distinct subfamily of CDD/CDA-like deaminases protein n=2 Tax=Leishmania donovani TaxID=5661 RepID=A0A504XJP7_LEIDO|nr:A distinct subfamily of CDD/CDA-like deaminases protein [Leishmania donovani]